MVAIDRIYKQAFNGSLEKRSESYKDAEEAIRDTPGRETTVFTSGKKNLTFIGGLHINKRTWFVDFIEKVIKETKPQVVLFELPRDISNEYFKHTKTNKTEVGYGVQIAERYGATPVPMDLELKDWSMPYLKHKDSDAVKAGIFIDIFRTYDGLQKYNSDVYVGFGKADFYDLAIANFIRNTYNGTDSNFKDTFVKLAHRYKGTIMERAKQINEEATRKYVDKKLSMEHVLDIKDLHAPYPFSKLELGKIVRWQDAWRNKSMIDTCLSNLRKYDSVVALAGWGHIYECRNIIADEMKKAFGQVKVERWNAVMRHG